MEPYHAFLDTLVKALVDHPEDVVIVQTVDNLGVLLTLTVHPDDMGKVIGRGGRIATQAIRPLLTAVGLKLCKKYQEKVMIVILSSHEAFELLPITFGPLCFWWATE
jgi:predicted RNA-binding protein YlqC (UPF0109 family)